MEHKAGEIQESRAARSRLRIAAVIGVSALVLFGIVAIADMIATRSAIAAERQRLNRAAELYSAVLQSELEKFRLVPLTLADSPDAADLLLDKSASNRKFNLRLEALAKEIEAAAIYLVNRDGLTLAASNWRLPTSFVGAQYDFRPYFMEAMQAGSSEQFALGTVSNRPGLYIARRIQIDGKAMGVMVVKVEFDTLEDQWRRAQQPVFVTTPEGIILITSNASWRFQSAGRLSEDPEQLARLQDRLSIPEIRTMPLYRDGRVGRIDDAGIAGYDYGEAISESPPGWQIHVLGSLAEPVARARTQARYLVIIALMAMLIAGALYYIRRRNRAMQAEALANARMQELRLQLEQANKLATLGQVAAGVGHEINQPVSAIKVYAENGEKLIGLNKDKAVGENFAQIVRLTERIGRITEELRSFSRKATGKLVAVNVQAAIDGALLLLRDAIRQADAQIVQEQPDAGIAVMAEHMRLEQVLVNLIQNALEATGKGAVITISVDADSESAAIAVADNGPGLTEDMRERLFQPFSTSKRDGLGLGLVISRDIINDLGGELNAGFPETGASFSIRLRRAS
ncbi:MAG: ATP-binding protein [Blastomonas sp.]